MKISLLRLAAAVAVALSACHSRQPADLLVLHAKIYTVDTAFSTAQAMAVRDGKILAMGSDAAILGAYTAKDTIDAGGKVVYPGFIDAHGHFVEYGESLFMANLFGCASAGEMVQRVKAFADAHPGLAWIQGHGWDQNKFPGKNFPDNKDLNRLFPNTPVVLGRVDGHALLANAAALSLAGIHAGQTLVGGTIETKNGELTGILVDNAQRLVGRQMPELSAGDFWQRVDAAQRNCFAQGLTTVTDPGLDRTDIERLDSLQRAGKLKMRVYVMLRDKKENLDYYIPRGPYKTDLLYVKGVKAYADGALGSRGACLLADYTDRPGWKGFLLSNPAHYDSLAAR